MQRHFYRSILLLSCVMTTGVGTPKPALAQESETTGIETVVVTAEKREEDLQHVPISMSVISGDVLASSNIRDLQDISPSIPNFRVDLDGFFVSPRLRGFSTDPRNLGFEQAVGLVVDGVPYTRAGYFQTAFLDVDQVEVLRGPQGTLFGKNTTVGLVNIVTKKPTDDFQATFDVGRGDLEQGSVFAAVGGPLLPGLVNFRAAGNWIDQAGYVSNTSANVVIPTETTPGGAPSKLGGQTRQSGRVTLATSDAISTHISLSYEFDHVNATGAPTEILTSPGNLTAYLRIFDPTVDVTPGNYVGSVGEPQHLRRNIDSITFKAEREFGGWQAQFIGGYSLLRSDALFDNDYTPLPDRRSFYLQHDAQTTAEVLLNSPELPGLFGLPVGRATTFTAGAFYQDAELADSEEFDISTQYDQDVRKAAAGVAFPFVLSNTLEGVTTDFGQSGHTYALFGQANWSIIDGLGLIIGGRYSWETKIGKYVNTLTPNAFLLAFASRDFVDNGKIGEKHFTPKIGLTYDVSSTINLYGTFSEGYRGGGFNTTVPVAVSPLKPESIWSWEAGAKMVLLQDLRLNVGLYWMKMKDLQVPTQVFTTGIGNVSTFTNAGAARSRGLEADLFYVPTDWLTVTGGLAYNDAIYLDFKTGACEPGQAPPSGVCDLTGKPLQDAPKWSATLQPSVRWPLAPVASYLEGIDVTSGLTIQHVSSYLTKDSEVIQSLQPAYWMLDGNIGLLDDSKGWSLILTVKNLTDQLVVVRMDNLKPTAGLEQDVLTGRQFFVHLRKTF